MANIKNNEIIIDDGVREYQVMNQRREPLGVFYFNPTDFDMLRRFEESESRINALTEELDRAESGDQQIKAMSVFSEKIKTELDYVINGNSAECFFTKCSPVSLVGGKLYFEHVLDAISQVIKMENGNAVRRQNERRKRYTQKYNGHKNGHR